MSAGPVVYSVVGNSQHVFDVIDSGSSAKWSTEDMAITADDIYRPLAAAVTGILNLRSAAEWLEVEIPSEWYPRMVDRLSEAAVELRRMEMPS